PDVDGRSLLAGVRYSTHDFAGALELARGVVVDDPSRVGDLATVGDAQLELGRYDDAAATYAQVSATHPDAAATSLRMARLAYVEGRPGDARRMAATAEDQAKAAALGGPSLSL